jgi:hypothetical protein
MLSLDLFDSRYERRLHEGAVDDTIAHLIEPLSRRAIDIRTQLRSGKLSGAEINKLEKEYEDLVQKRLDIILDRQPKNEQQVPSKQDPFAYVKPEPKGIGDIQDPKTKMAQLAQRAKKGPLANVGAGIKAFIKGEPEPMDEQQELGRRGIGMANMKSLQATVEKGFARTIFQFPNIKYVVGEDDTDKMADYYNGQDAAGRTNFVYNVMGDGMKFIQLCKELGISPEAVEPKQPELPGFSPQGELPLAERQNQKKKSDDDIKAGDVKTAREIQKIRAQYPAAGSDIEALARSEIDSTERSQQQIGRLRSSNTKQDELLKQIMDLDREQSKEIDTLDNENDGLEQQLARVQGLNDRLTQAVSQMTSAPRSVSKTAQRQAQKVAPATIDLIPGAPADQSKPSVAPTVAKEKPPAIRPKAAAEPAPEPVPELPTNVISLSKFSPPERLVKAQKVSGSDITEGQPQELIHRYLAIDAENDVDAVRAAIQAISRDPTLGATSKSRLLGQIGMIIRRHRLPIGRSYYTYMQRYMEEQSVAETVTDVKTLWADVYRRLAPKIERHRDSFLAGQLYDELENIAELHGAEGEFKRMMSTARNRAHMEYDTNPGGFHNWFWFLPFEDEQVNELDVNTLKSYADKRGAQVAAMKADNPNPTAGSKEWVQQAVPAQKVARAGQKIARKERQQGVAEGTDDIKKRMSKLEALALAANRAGDDAKCKMYQQKIQSLKQKLSQSMSEAVDKKGVAEGLLYSGDTWQDVLYRINVLNDIFGDQKDLAATFEPASQPEWGPFRDQILRSRTVLDTYAKVKQLANMNVPLTDVEIEMLADVAWDGGGGPVEPAGHWSERDYDWLEDLYAQQFAVVQHLLDQRAQGYGQNKTKSGQTVHEQGVAEGLKSGEYHIHTVYFKDGTKKRIRVTSDEFDVADYYTKRGQAVDRVDYDFQIYSDMTEAVKEPTTRQELLDRVDKLQRMMSQERNPANLQILRKELEMIKQRYQHLREDNDSEAVERAILNRIMVAHTDLLMKFGPDKVMQAAEEVAYNVGDVDEIGTSDVSAYVHQVKQILGVPQELDEKWSQKYKSSINCANPKGFSQKAHCAGKKK